MKWRKGIGILKPAPLQYRQMFMRDLDCIWSPKLLAPDIVVSRATTYMELQGSGNMEIQHWIIFLFFLASHA